MHPCPLLAEIIEQLVEDSVRDYRIKREAAFTFIHERVCKEAENFALSRFSSLKQVKRTKWFKVLKSTIKKELYYSLRQYKSNLAEFATLTDKLAILSEEQFEATREALLQEIATCHISSHERFDEMEIFYKELFDFLSHSKRQCKTVLDVGCGIQPAFFPFNVCPLNLTNYTAIDRDGYCIDLLKALSKYSRYSALKSVKWDLNDGWEPVNIATRIESFDLALLLKFVPVAERTNAANIDSVLATVPATIWVISGAKEAMAKRRNIEKRERATIEDYIVSCGKKTIASIELNSEFFYIVE